jgi:hypothetical protein
MSIALDTVATAARPVDVIFMDPGAVVVVEVLVVGVPLLPIVVTTMFLVLVGFSGPECRRERCFFSEDLW